MNWHDLTTALTGVLTHLAEGVQLCTNAETDPHRFVQASISDDATTITLQTNGPVAYQGPPLLTDTDCTILEHHDWLLDPLTGFYELTTTIPARWATYQRLAQAWTTALHHANHIATPDNLVLRCWQDGGTLTYPDGQTKTWPTTDPYPVDALPLRHVDSTWPNSV